MRVALLSTFAASRKEPLVQLLNRVYQGFADAGVEPFIRFNFADGGVVRFSSVDRVLKKHPQLERFVTTASPAPQLRMPEVKRLSNGPLSPGANEAMPYAMLQAIAAGVPRAYPFHHATLHLHSPQFGELLAFGPSAPGMLPGVMISDSWWVNARQRSLSACWFNQVELGAKKLPAPSGSLATILAGCGKARKTIQAPLPDNLGQGPVPGVRLTTGALMPSAKPELVAAVKAISVKYRESMAEIAARLPHDLPEPGAMLRQAAGVSCGPKKPALVEIFKPMGYSVSGGTGTFILRRRTAANSTLELHLDTGTWSHSVTAIFMVYGLGFKATLILPPTQKAVGAGQYSIADAEHWRKIVENFGALVAELERTFVPEVEAVTGPSPEWYEPEK